MKKDKKLGNNMMKKLFELKVSAWSPRSRKEIHVDAIEENGGNGQGGQAKK